MRKLLLFVALATFSMTTFGQTTVWNVGNDATNFPVSAGIGAGPDKSVYVNALGIHTGSATNTNMGQVEANSKTFTSATDVEYSFVNRFKFNGAGLSTDDFTDGLPNLLMPKQRYLTIDVAGNSTLYFIGTSGSSSSARKMFVTDGEKMIGTLDYPDGTLKEGTVNYTGAATKLYIFCNAAINLYYISATNTVTTSTNTVNANKAVVAEKFFDVLGREVSHKTKGLVIKKTIYEDGTSSTSKSYIRKED